MDTPEMIAAYTGLIGGIGAIILSIFTHINQIRNTRIEEKKQAIQQKIALEETQVAVENQVWTLAREQIKALRDEVILLREQLNKERIDREEAVALERTRRKQEIEAERIKRKRVEEDQKRLVGIIITLLQQMDALVIKPKLSDEDLRWVQMFYMRDEN